MCADRSDTRKNEYSRRRFALAKTKCRPHKKRSAQECPWVVSHLRVKKRPKHDSGRHKQCSEQDGGFNPLPLAPFWLRILRPQKNQWCKHQRARSIAQPPRAPDVPKMVPIGKSAQAE